MQHTARVEGRVTVADNGNAAAAATRFADRTFVRTNLTLLDGDNTFVATAQDALARTASVTTTSHLPASVSYSYDSNGNLLTDGRRHFTYDDENQLTTVVLTNRTKSEFVYDGKMRRRVRKEFAWTGQWQQTLEVRYLYDGNLVVQERHHEGGVPTSYPQRTVTYTRGLDLSGTMQGAGGIGGLLARSESSPLAAPGSMLHAFYHSDSVGNVTALVDTNQQVVARYLYEPFGAVIAMSGPLATANTYRFSSKEAHEPSGLVYYLYRYYEPGLQRWVNRDPIGDEFFLSRRFPSRVSSAFAEIQSEVFGNQYRFTRNNSLQFLDPNGDLAIEYPLAVGGVIAVTVTTACLLYPPCLKAVKDLLQELIRSATCQQTSLVCNWTGAVHPKLGCQYVCADGQIIHKQPGSLGCKIRIVL